MATVRRLAAVLTLVVLAGCGGKVLQIPMKDGAGVEKKVAFPKGTVFGGASRKQAGAIAQMVADTNTAAAERAAASLAAAARVEAGQQRLQTGVDDISAAEKREEESLRRLETGQKKVEEEVRQVAAVVEKVETATQKIDASVKRVAEGQERLEETARETLDTAKKTWDTTRMTIEAFEKVARRQGTGEVTVFFARGSARIARAGLEERRLVAFVDWLGRESRGRKIMFVAVGSASATGSPELNVRLAKQRSEALLGVIDRYLVNVPHEYVRLYGTGDTYSPKDGTGEEHERYQHARLIAFFEKGQEPALPAEP